MLMLPTRWRKMRVGKRRNRFMSVEEENMALVRRFEEAVVRGDLDAVDEMLAPDFVNHNKLLSGQEPDRESYKRAISTYQAALSLGEGGLIIEDQVAAGDKVVTRVVAHRIHDRGSLWALRLAAGS
jgi:ketosteroid isomerase-like protein